jgi:Ras-related protein Rab-1A
MFVYDVSNRESFEGLKHWFGEAERYTSAKVVKTIVGHKQDSSLDRAVSEDEARVFQV